MFKKKVQKFVPQKLEIIANSTEFTVKTGLLEILPNDCMCGISECYMDDRNTTIIVSETPPYHDYVTTIFSVGSVGNCPTQLLPSITVTNSIIKNCFSGFVTIDDVNNGIYTDPAVRLTLTQTTFDNLYFVFNGFTFYSTQINLTDPNLSPSFNGFSVYLNTDLSRIYKRVQIISRVILEDNSQSIILAINEQIGDVFVGDVLSLGNDSGVPYNQVFYTVQQVISTSILRVNLGFQDVPLTGAALDTDLTTTTYDMTLYRISDCLSFAIDGNIYHAVLGQILKLTRTTYTINDITYPLPQTNIFGQFFSAVDCDISMYATNNIYSTIPMPSPAININIESPLFTSGCSYNTITKSYSSSIASMPVNELGVVSYSQPVNNHNCSMYQINKNILNNFEIPFKITMNDGTSNYKIQNPDTFFIRFVLWFYSQDSKENIVDIQ